MRVGVETPGPPAYGERIFAKPWLGKERWTKKRAFSSAPDTQASGVGLLISRGNASAKF
jgi:hypothetical protein